MLTVARTLMGNPKLILVDEPTEGLAPLIAKDVLEMLSAVPKSGVTVSWWSKTSRPPSK